MLGFRQQAKRQRRLGGRWRALAALLLGCAASSAAFATPDSIALILSEEGGVYQEFANQFRTSMDAAGARNVRVSVLSAAKLPPGADPSLAAADLLVTVGVRATEEVLRSRPRTPVLATLVPRSSLGFLKKDAEAKDRAFSAIYLDQPLARRFALIREVLPGRTKVGVVLGPDSAGDQRALQAAARDQGLLLYAEQIAAPDELLPALRRLLTEVEVLLAVPDGLVFNRTTAQSVLLTSYRAQDPLIAYSQSYVSAGALAAVHSTPAQLGQQAAELVSRLAKAGTTTLPAPQYPKYFSVSTNPQVAHSLGIDVPEEAILQQRLMARETRE
jgi:ABC-type uncharacterized transport system substrate-binding protein